MKRYFDCIFADDIRTEMGGKHSIIGIHNHVLALNAPPAMIPKMAVSLNCFTDFDHPFKQIAIKVLLDDTVIVQNELPPEFLEQSFNENRKLLEDAGVDLSSQMYRVTANIHLNPFVIKQDGKVSVFITADGKETLAGSLFLRIPKNPR